jgi:hypothetical protein
MQIISDPAGSGSTTLLSNIYFNTVKVAPLQFKVALPISAGDQNFRLQKVRMGAIIPWGSSNRVEIVDQYVFKKNYMEKSRSPHSPVSSQKNVVLCRSLLILIVAALPLVRILALLSLDRSGHSYFIL